MRKLGFIFLVLLLSVAVISGCGTNEASIEEIEARVQVIKEFAEVRSYDVENFVKELEDFNRTLEGVKDDNLSKYVDLQTEANLMRIEGLESGDNDLISDSSWKQASALQELGAVKNSK